MKKKLIALLLVPAFTAAPILISDTAYAEAIIPITAPSAVLLDSSSARILYAKTPNLRRAPASTTKLLTSLVALEQLDKDQVITISGIVGTIEPSKIYLHPGERYYVRDLVRATLINSANDAAESLSYAGGKGSRWRFVQLMNAKAKALGCKQSHWANASGLPARNQYSTAYDMALIMREAQRNPFLLDVLKTKTTTISSLDGRRIPLKNHNKMLWQGYRQVLGKTGWTRTARHCFVGVINSNNHKVFVAMLGSHRLWKDLKTLVDYQFGLSLYRIRENKKIHSDDRRKWIQSALKKAGYDPGSADGQFGRTTIRAIQRFQKANHLRPDGIAGSDTIEKLKAYA